MNTHLLTPIPFSPTDSHSPQMVEVERAYVTLLARRKGARYNRQNLGGKPGTPPRPPPAYQPLTLGANLPGSFWRENLDNEEKLKKTASMLVSQAATFTTERS